MEKKKRKSKFKICFHIGGVHCASLDCAGFLFNLLKSALESINTQSGFPL